MCTGHRPIVDIILSPFRPFGLEAPSASFCGLICLSRWQSNVVTDGGGWDAFVKPCSLGVLSVSEFGEVESRGYGVCSRVTGRDPS